jgi:hypothetical protein
VPDGFVTKLLSSCCPCGQNIVLHPRKLRYHQFMRQFRDFVIAVTAAVMLALAVYLTFAIAHWGNRGEGLHLADTTSVVHEVQSLSEIITVKYVIEKVVVLEDVKWYGENRVLLLAHGVVKAGIDVKRVQPSDVSISGKTISVRLPLPQITDAYLDDKQTQVIDHSTGLLRSFDKDLEQTARAEAVEEISLAARQGGILKDADSRAREELETFFKRAGFESVVFR